jgi:hypothetical protein
VAVVAAGREDAPEIEEFCSIEGQILNQQPEFQFC